MVAVEGTVSRIQGADFGAPEIFLQHAGIIDVPVQIHQRHVEGGEGPVNPEGTLIDGTWEQGGPPMTLKMERVSALDTPTSR